jgi:hypothetical protein
MEMEKVELPECKSGIWRIEHTVVTSEDSAMTRLNVIKDGRGYVPEGTYTTLYRNSTVVMSDTPDEMRDHYAVMRVGGRAWWTSCRLVVPACYA